MDGNDARATWRNRWTLGILGNDRASRDTTDMAQWLEAGDATAEDLPLSDGEIHFLWWFIQGSIMEPDIRWRLRRAWGMCGRHAWGALSAEAAFYHGFLHGPAVLYVDLMERALGAFQVRGALQVRRLVRRLRATGPCLMCEMGYNAASRGMAREKLVEEGRDTSALRAFAEETRVYWWKTVCGRCIANGASARCRPHLLEEATLGAMRDLTGHHAQVQNIFEHLRVYKQSFVWEYHGTDTAEDRAALISAIGWCSGWLPWIGSIWSTGP